jgi:two-component system, cell cycle response regulator
MKILLVEDDRITRLLVKKILTKAGHEVVEANDGVMAWDLFQHEHFQFVITDWMMPALDGLGLIQLIRANTQKNYTYIILLTAMDDIDNVVIGLESGADEYLTKPCNNRELIARVASGMRIIKLEEQFTQTRRQLEILAMHDSLTSLYNRRAIEEYAEAEFNRLNRKENPLSVIMLDIDHFKNINDQYGHKAGDHALRQVAQVLTEDLRKYDRVGRWGGEEFILILPDISPQQAMAVAERIRAQVASLKIYLEENEPFSVQASLGVASNNGQFPSLSKLIDAADQALYHAKEEGRNRVRSFDPGVKS